MSKEPLAAPLSKEEILAQLPADLKKRLERKDIDDFNNFQEDVESFKKRKISDFIYEITTRNPFVPLGLIATSWFLGRGFYGLVNENRNKIQQQKMMRGRVLAQAFTVAAFGVSAIYYIAKKKEENEF